MSSGKSTVCRFLADLGAYVIDADEVVHRLLSPDTAVGRKVIDLLGLEILVEGQLDRAKIAKKVFSQPLLLHSLENILHPAAREEIAMRYQQVTREQKYPLFVAEISLLYEAGWEKDYDRVIAVVADPAFCRQRFLGKTKGALEDYEKRMQRQLLPEEKAARADDVIVNNGDRAQLRSAVEKLYPTLLWDINEETRR